MTSLVVYATQTSGIGIGSRIVLLKKVNKTDVTQTGVLDVQGDIEDAWQKVFETEIGSYMTVPDHADWDISANFTIDFWVKSFWSRTNPCSMGRYK